MTMVWLLPTFLAAAVAVVVHFSLRRGGGDVGGGKQVSSISNGVGDERDDVHQTPQKRPSSADGDSDANADADAAPPSASPYFAIGDLHGDVRCARHWVGRTGLVANFRPEADDDDDDDDPDRWTWNDDVGSALIFAGDYVDKGPTSRQTVEFVRTLTLRFPDRVTAILGNHELELLRDRDAAADVDAGAGGGSGSRWGWGGYHQLAYASAHPAEYLNYLETVDESDELAVELLYNASAEVYGLRHHQVAKIAPPPPLPGDVATRDAASTYYETYGMIPITEYIDPRHRDLVSEKLGVFQRAYLDAYRSDTELGRWVEERPVLHLASDGTLFVHGGVSGEAASHLMTLAADAAPTAIAGKDDDERSANATAVDNLRAGLDRLNGLFRTHARGGVRGVGGTGDDESSSDGFAAFLDSTATGQTVDELVTYRGNHPHPRFGGDEACAELKSVLDVLGGAVRRIAVGHTPDESVRIDCDGRLLAVDSLLGRWIRASGNDYCPAFDAKRKGGREPPRSRNGKYVCSEVGDLCEGQIVRFDADGKVTLIH